ncbi:MAG: diacylglycerol kinase family lipid kinase, partial [Chloroflexi bacterium]|nr:diacylglycerol kinase family lipid kinase [Chloroflexota bacterium]
TLLTIGNGRCSGGGFWLTPNAKIDDGIFDLCIARELSKPQMLALVPHVMKGTHMGKERVRMLRARSVLVTSDEPLPVHADGEILYTDAHRVEAELLAAKLEVIG